MPFPSGGLSITITDSQFAGILMLSMPTPSWDPVIGTLDRVLDTKVIILHLNTEWSRPQGPTSIDKDSNNVFQTGTKLKCKNCSRTGHTITKCWAKGVSQEGQYPEWWEGRRDTHRVKAVTDTHIVWTYGYISQPDVWFANSAMMVHVSPIQEDFMSMTSAETSRHLEKIP